MPINAALHKKLISWAQERLLCGWSADDLIQGMVKVGHSSESAHKVAQEVFSDDEPDTIHSAGDALTANTSNFNSSPLANNIQLPGCKVSVLLTLSQPRVILLSNLLSSSECEALIEMSRPDLKRASVVDQKTGKNRADQGRITSSKGFSPSQTPLISQIEERIALLSGLPMSHQEGMQVLYYPVGGFYKPHHDYFDPALAGSANILNRGGQRVATIVIYLNDVEEGGGTAFPTLNLEAKAKQGNAVYFESVDENGQIDPKSLHASSPVIRGAKWIAVKWIRAEPWSNC